MKFYLCQTAEGPRYARTQAEAKALDPRFELVNYETDQAALVERFNELLKTPATIGFGDTHTIGTVDATQFDPEAVIAIGRAMDEEDGGYPPERRTKAAKGSQDNILTDWGKAPPPGSCERCEAMSEAARKIEGIMAATNIEWTLMSADAAFVERIQQAVNDRRAELGT